MCNVCRPAKNQRTPETYICLKTSSLHNSPSHWKGKTYAPNTMTEHQDRDQHRDQSTKLGPPTAPPATAPATTTSSRRQLPQLLTAKILTLILQNGLALATHQPRPHTVHTLNALRADLILHSPFFDPTHQPSELRPRTRRSQISFTDLVVLMARLMRVLVRAPGPGGSTEAEERERVEVRRECFDLPFFDRGMEGSERPFGEGMGEGEVDEGCVV